MRSAAVSDLDPTFTGDVDQDIVIPKIGDAGVGKSYFLDRLLRAIGQTPGDAIRVGETLDNCTLRIEPVIVEDKNWIRSHLHISINPSPTRFVLADTPALDLDPSDSRTALRRVADWVNRSYPETLTETQMLVGGVIYLHDISKDRTPNTTRSNLLFLQSLIPEHLPSDWSFIVLVTTKWGSEEEGKSSAKEEELLRDHWGTLINSKGSENGARVDKMWAGSPEEAGNRALEILQPLLRRFDKWMGRTTLDVWSKVQAYCDGKRIRNQEFTQSLNTAIREVIQVLNRVSAAETKLEEGDKLPEVDTNQLEADWKESYEAMDKLRAQISTWDQAFLYIQGLAPGLWRMIYGSTVVD